MTKITHCRCSDSDWNLPAAIINSYIQTFCQRGNWWCLTDEVVVSVITLPVECDEVEDGTRVPPTIETFNAPSVRRPDPPLWRYIDTSSDRLPTRPARNRGQSLTHTGHKTWSGGAGRERTGDAWWGLIAAGCGNEVLGKGTSSPFPVGSSHQQLGVSAVCYIATPVDQLISIR